MNSGGFRMDAGGYERPLPPPTLLEGAIAYYEKKRAENYCSAERAEEIEKIVQQFSAVDIYMNGEKESVSRWQIYPPEHCDSKGGCTRMGVFVKRDEAMDMNLDGYLSASEIAVAQYTENPEISSYDLAQEVKAELNNHILAEARFRDHLDKVARADAAMFGLPIGEGLVAGIPAFVIGKVDGPLVLMGATVSAVEVALAAAVMGMAVGTPLVRILDAATTVYPQPNLKTERIQ